MPDGSTVRVMNSTPSFAPRQVVIAGGGIAALETALALRALAGGSLAITLVAPTDTLYYRPLAVAESFGHSGPHAYRLDAICEDLDLTLRREALRAVQPDRRSILTHEGLKIPYDDLVIAVGAIARPALPHVHTFLAHADHESMAGLLAEGQEGTAVDIAFVVPTNTGWSLPLYELALTFAQWSRDLYLDNLRLTIVTPEDVPLAAFRGAASAAVARHLHEAGIAILTSTYARAFDGRVLALAPGDRSIVVDHVVALPALAGPGTAGVPRDADGFVRVDDHGRVHDLPGVYAVGDAATFPLKQGGLAAQQADLVAALIAREAGCDVPEPQPHPVLRAILLTGGEPLFLEAAIAGGETMTSRVHARCPWSPPHKIAARHLAPYLADHESAYATTAPRP